MISRDDIITQILEARVVVSCSAAEMLVRACARCISSRVLSHMRDALRRLAGAARDDVLRNKNWGKKMGFTVM